MMLKFGQSFTFSILSDVEEAIPVLLVSGSAAVSASLAAEGETYTEHPLIVLIHYYYL